MIYSVKIQDTEISFNARSDRDAELISRTISDLLTGNGFVNLDPEDVIAVTAGAENITAGIGTGSGDDRAMDSARQAVENMDIARAKRILLEVKTGTEITLAEMSEVAIFIEEAADPDAMIIWGHVIDEAMGDQVKTIVLAS